MRCSHISADGTRCSSPSQFLDPETGLGFLFEVGAADVSMTPSARAEGMPVGARA